MRTAKFVFTNNAAIIFTSEASTADTRQHDLAKRQQNKNMGLGFSGRKTANQIQREDF